MNKYKQGKVMSKYIERKGINEIKGKIGKEINQEVENVDVFCVCVACTC